MNKKVEIMDTTLRDGEQMRNVSYAAEEKLTISKILLTEVNVDRLELTSARVSEGEKQTVKKIVEWSDSEGLTDRLEILSFADYDKSVDWVAGVGIKRVNLLTKGSLKHCLKQLNMKPEEHFKRVGETIEYANKKGLEVNVYLEDFSNGYFESKDYLFDLIRFLGEYDVKRVMLPDTLGIMEPFQVYESVKEVIGNFPGRHFDFHPHNDYGLGTSNALAAVGAGIDGIHLTVNGMGERAGNAPLDEVAVGIRDFLKRGTSINEKKLWKVSKYVEMFSAQRMANNKPIYGKNVFIQTAGIHADGDKKGGLYANRLKPERFGKKREYALGKLSGKANLEMNLAEMGIELTEEKKKILLKKVIELGDKKKVVTKEDLPFLISDIFETPQDLPFKLVSCSITSTYQLKPYAAVKCEYNGGFFEDYGYGDGGYNAFMNALERILKKCEIQIPRLMDYVVTIPPTGKTDALVQASISWEVKQKEGKRIYVTRGVNSDQNIAAIEATLKIINIMLNNHCN